MVAAEYTAKSKVFIIVAIYISCLVRCNFLCDYVAAVMACFDILNDGYHGTGFKASILDYVIDRMVK